MRLARESLTLGPGNVSFSLSFTIRLIYLFTVLIHASTIVAARARAALVARLLRTRNANNALAAAKASLIISLGRSLS